MVKITNGINVFEVTKGAFDGYFARQGYTPYVEPKITENVIDVPEEVSEDDKFINAIMEKPISQWNKEEVKHFAAIKGIDISGTKNANEARNLIKDFLAE